MAKEKRSSEDPSPEKKVSIVEKFFRWVEKIASAVLLFLLKPFHKTLTEKQLAAWQQFVRYGVVGTANTVVKILAEFLVLWLIAKSGWNGAIGGLGGFNRHLGTLAGFVACVCNSYWFNSHYTFENFEADKKTPAQHAMALAKVALSYSFAVLFLGWALNFLWEFIHLNPFIGALINAAVGTPINFLLNKFWAFKE